MPPNIRQSRSYSECWMTLISMGHVTSLKKRWQVARLERWNVTPEKINYENPHPERAAQESGRRRTRPPKSKAGDQVAR